MPILHPTARALGRHADGDDRDPRLAAHLLRCDRCRRAVDALRSPGDAARAAAAPPPPADALDRILARRAAGDRVLLPVDGPAPAPRALPRRAMLAAAAVALLVIAGALLFRPHELEAGRSELRLIPANPHPGQTVRVEYRPGARLEHEPVLILRAAEQKPGADQLRGGRVVARLTRTAGGLFTGSYRLPGSIAYARFAVEDGGGSRVDASEAWDVVAAAADGRPGLEGMKLRYHARSFTNTLAAARTADSLAALYPDAPGAWLRAWWAASEAATEAARDTLKRVHRQQLRRVGALVAAQPRPAVGDLADMVFYADALDDTALALAWRRRLLERDSLSAAAFQQRVFATVERYRGHPARELAEFERMWSQGGRVSPQLPFTATQVAAAAGDGEAVLRWGDRATEQDPMLVAFATRMALRFPAVRGEAMERARRTVRRLLAFDADGRPLELTVAEYYTMLRQHAAYFLGEMGKAMAAQGRHAAARDTLELAMADTWDLSIFRSVAQARLALGDTAGALQAYARVAADPETTQAFDDSVLAAIGARRTAREWPMEVTRARGQMRAWLTARAVDRPVRGRLLLVDASGARREIDPAFAGPTLVAFWSRYCPPSIAQLGQLQALHGQLTRRGVRLVTITDEAPSPEVRAFLARHGLTFPVLYDVDRAARRAFDNNATPRYLLLDRAGRIRFDSYAPDDILRQATVLLDAQNTEDRGRR